MSNSGRPGLRSTSTKVPPSIAASSVLPSPITFSKPDATSNKLIRRHIPGSKLPGIPVEELKLLREKQTRLAINALSTLNDLPDGRHAHKALEATLIFAQYEAGTAVCIGPAGWVLTCAHCFGDSEEEYENSNKRRWLLFYTGLAVQVECRVWDDRRDLALLKIIAIESSEEGAPTFAWVPVATDKPPYRLPIICIGQPGRDDLEATSSRRTKYHLVEISHGCFQGMVEGVDPQDNSEIGTLMHDAWTYWGHSGAPLLRESDGALVGLHSSWDDETAMRHGIPHVAIKGFLRENEPLLTDSSTHLDELPLTVGMNGSNSGPGTASSPIVIS
jgi:hypothetical protein